MFKSGYVTIIGRPNVGKSTLTNKLMGEKLSIVSSKPQTTRNNIQAILTKEDFQIIFVDTPGLHRPRHKLGQYMVKVAEDALKDVDVVIFMTNPSDNINPIDMHILEQIKDSNTDVLLVINKIDESTAVKVGDTIKRYSEVFDFKEIIPISARKGKNVDELLKCILKYLKEGPKYYPDEMITNQEERFIVSEIIREKALRLLNDEVPHGIAVDIVMMQKNKNGAYHIEGTLICEKESHKGIIIGKNGEKLKTISTYAREDIEKFVGSKVYLKLWVKYKKEWRDNAGTLKELGYK